jgi:hypothetical protein
MFNASEDLAHDVVRVSPHSPVKKHLHTVSPYGDNSDCRNGRELGPTCDNCPLAFVLYCPRAHILMMAAGGGRDGDDDEHHLP